MSCARFRDVDKEDPFFQGTGRGRRPPRAAGAGAWGHRGPTGPSGRWIRARGWRPGASPRRHRGRRWGHHLRDRLARGRRRARAGPERASTGTPARAAAAPLYCCRTGV